MAGVPVTAVEVNTTASQIARQVFASLSHVQRFQEFLLATPDATLIALGISSDDVAIIKSAFTDLEQLRTIFEGSVNLAVAKNFRTFSKQLLGTGLY